MKIIHLDFDIWQGESLGLFLHFCTYESTFYRGTDAFCRLKLSGSAKKLLRFEGRPSDKFPIKR